MNTRVRIRRRRRPSAASSSASNACRGGHANGFSTVETISGRGPLAGLESGAEGSDIMPVGPMADELAPLLAVRLLRIAGTVIVTAVLVFLALLVAVRFLIFPSLDEYRGHIAQTLTRDL